MKKFADVKSFSNLVCLLGLIVVLVLCTGPHLDIQ